jgi:DNA-binding SARP family transcriptional activator
VLEILALRPGSVLQPWELIDALWGEEPVDTARGTLKTYISALRRVLPEGSIETVGSGYCLRVAPDEVDVNRFERYVRQGREALEQGDARVATRRFSEALALWRGEPLAELVDQRVGATVISGLSERRRIAEEQLVDARLVLGEHDSLVADLTVAVGAEPLRDRRWEQLMLALYRSGRHAEALRTYQQLCTTLAELGLEPGPQVRELERAIATRDPDLQLLPAAPAGLVRAEVPLIDLGAHFPRIESVLGEVWIATEVERRREIGPGRETSFVRESGSSDEGKR